MIRQYVIALGANIGDKQNTLENAIGELSKRVGRLLKRSSWYVTEPLLDPQNPVFDQEDFLNGVALFESRREPCEVLRILQDIESVHGRSRTTRWGPRTIDLDIVCIGAEEINSPDLVVPHPEMHKRDFVLEPMLEVAADWIHPRLGLTTRELWERVCAQDLPRP